MASTDKVAFSSECSIGDHVLVCADMFNEGENHYLQSVGLGPALHADPPVETVFFVAKLTRLFPSRKKCRLKFLFDSDVLDVSDNKIYRVATAAEVDKQSFYVFKPGEGRTLFQVNGVMFIKAGTEEPKKPQMFSTATAPRDAQPRLYLPVTTPQVNVRVRRGGLDPPALKTLRILGSRQGKYFQCFQCFQ